VVIARLADALGRGVEDISSSVSEAFFEPVIRLGVTGLSRAGKTVFITSLVANLTQRARMPGLQASSSGAIRAAFLQPQPDDTVPRFDYERYLAALTSPTPHWPESTRAISELRLSFRVQPTGLLGSLKGPRTIHLDIVDYPGEWLLDLALLNKDYESWSRDVLSKAALRRESAEFLAQIDLIKPDARHDELTAKALAEGYTAFLHKAQDARSYDLTPGRFLLPGELAGSPALTFAPLPEGPSPRRSLRREMARRYDAYVGQVVKPFFRNHFARIDRQIVLVDALGAIHKGPRAVEEMRNAMAEILSAFRPGRNSFLSALMGKRIDRILFAATKADHLHHTQHPQLTAIMEALVQEARARADFSGAQTQAMSIAALRATVEETRSHNGDTLDVVRGTLLDSGKPAALYPGDLPRDPYQLISPAREGATEWLNADYQIMNFAPAQLSLGPGEGPPHIRLDRAAEFLFGDKLR
jgi:predicted YcjX-like family ATPase